MSSSTPSLPTPLDGIMKIAPYVPGESKLVSDKPILQLAANEGALGPSPKAIEAIRNMSDDLHRYPDGMAKTL
ncbi:MAG: histidinol-phosphate transaminase, partial [Alphaproteobacteria bacterium]